MQACNRNSRRVDTLAVLMTLTIDGDGKVTAVDAAPQDQDGGKASGRSGVPGARGQEAQVPGGGHRLARAGTRS